MNQRAYRRTQRWFREHPESRREYNRRYYLKRAEKLRADAKAKRAENPNYTIEANRRFRELNPNYRREYYESRKLRDALSKFAKVCAANRGAL